MSQYTYLIIWQYCKDPNDINNAILERDENWEGLTSAEQIISIIRADGGGYMVFWRVRKWLDGREEP